MPKRILVGAFFASRHCRRIGEGAVARLNAESGKPGGEPVEVELISDYGRFLRLSEWERWDGAVIYGNYYQVAFGLPQHGMPSFASFGIPYVDTSNRYADGPGAKVIQDDAAVGRMAARFYAARKVPAAAFLGFTDAVAFSRERRLGFEEGCRKAGINVFIGPASDPDARREMEREAQARLLEWLAALPDGCGIFAANDDLAIRVLRASRTGGRRIPQDLLLLGVDNETDMTFSQGIGLSSIDVGPESVGAQAAGLLLEALATGQAPASVHRVSAAILMERESTDALLLQAPPALRRIVQQMRESPHTIPDIEALADRHKLGRRTLERQFARTMGESPHAFLQRLRLDRARHLLATTDWKISRIAGESGFTDEKWFLQCFKKATGRTPTAYRRQAGRLRRAD